MNEIGSMLGKTVRAFRSSTLLLIVALLLVTACSNENLLADQSTADVLIPVDEKYGTEWFFEMDSVDNYVFYSNWSKTAMVPTIEGTPSVIGYQVNNEELFTGGSHTGTSDDQPEKRVVRRALSESYDAVASDICESVDSSSNIVECEAEYVDLLGDPADLKVFIQHRNDGSALVVLPCCEEGEEDVALEYLRGEFESVEFDEAAMERLRD